MHIFIVVLLDTCVVNPDCDAFWIELVALDECLDAAADNAVLEVALEVATFPVHATLRQVGMIAPPPPVADENDRPPLLVGLRYRSGGTHLGFGYPTTQLCVAARYRTVCSKV